MSPNIWYLIAIMRKYLFLVWVLGLHLAGAGQDLQVETLQCEYRGNVLGLDEPHPRLSWSLQSGVADQYQSAYRVLIASSKAFLNSGRGDWWDSGKMKDSENINIVPGGKPFANTTELLDLLRTDDRFPACMTTKLLTYALGRGMVATCDPNDIDALTQQFKADNFQLRNHIMRIVQSNMFGSARAR